jgi:hypothetical protein
MPTRHRRPRTLRPALSTTSREGCCGGFDNGVNRLRTGSCHQMITHLRPGTPQVRRANARSWAATCRRRARAQPVARRRRCLVKVCDCRRACAVTGGGRRYSTMPGSRTSTPDLGGTASAVGDVGELVLPARSGHSPRTPNAPRPQHVVGALPSRSGPGDLPCRRKCLLPPAPPNCSRATCRAIRR